MNLPPPSTHPGAPPLQYPPPHHPPHNYPPTPHQLHPPPPLQHPPHQQPTHQPTPPQPPIVQDWPPANHSQSQWISPHIYHDQDLQHKLAAARSEAAAQNHELASLRHLLASRTPASPGSTISEPRTINSSQPYTNLSSVNHHYLTSHPPFNPDQQHQPQNTYPQPHHHLHTQPPTSQPLQTQQQQITYDQPPQPQTHQPYQHTPTLEETQRQQLADLQHQHRLQLTQQQQDTNHQQTPPHTQSQPQHHSHTQQPTQSTPHHSTPTPATQGPQLSQSISPSGYNPTPGHLQFTNITQDALDLTAPRPDLAGLDTQLNSLTSETTNTDSAQASHNPFASQSTTDLTGTSQATTSTLTRRSLPPRTDFPDPARHDLPTPPTDRPSHTLSCTRSHTLPRQTQVVRLPILTS